MGPEHPALLLAAWEDEAEQAARKRYRTRMGLAVPAAERLAQARKRAGRAGTIRRNRPPD